MSEFYKKMKAAADCGKNLTQGKYRADSKKDTLPALKHGRYFSRIWH